MSKQMREEFEALWLASDYTLEDLKLDGMGGYEDGDTYAAFYWFKASRAALCVELPDVSGHYGHSKYMHGVVDCRNAIQSAGVKTK
jgi:hypothetical protein